MLGDEVEGREKEKEKEKEEEKESTGWERLS